MSDERKIVAMDLQIGSKIYTYNDRMAPLDVSVKSLVWKSDRNIQVNGNLLYNGATYFTLEGKDFFFNKADLISNLTPKLQVRKEELESELEIVEALLRAYKKGL